MTVGTKSLLFGVHQFALHPLLVALAWWKLYGFPWDPRLWVCFVVHDWGYWGKPDMDGPEGKLHPSRGAAIVNRVVDGRRKLCPNCLRAGSIVCWGPWARFCLLHSRDIARRLNTPPSRLCVADKYAVCLYPGWLYLLLAKNSGEYVEFRQTLRMNNLPSGEREWVAAVNAHFLQWTSDNAGRTDLWRKPA